MAGWREATARPGPLIHGKRRPGPYARARPAASSEAGVGNAGVANEDTMVAWGLRNGPDGSNMSFNYGSSPDYAAVGHWGSPDIGWGPTVPAAKQWHYLAYTYDGDITRVYID